MKRKVSKKPEINSIRHIFVVRFHLSVPLILRLGHGRKHLNKTGWICKSKFETLSIIYILCICSCVTNQNKQNNKKTEICVLKIYMETYVTSL